MIPKPQNSLPTPRVLSTIAVPGTAQLNLTLDMDKNPETVNSDAFTETMQIPYKRLSNREST